VKGERLMARVRAHSRSMGPKMDSLLYAILGSCATASSRPCGSDRQTLKDNVLIGIRSEADV
jgi:hypothetical protein